MQPWLSSILWFLGMTRYLRFHRFTAALFPFGTGIFTPLARDGTSEIFIENRLIHSDDARVAVRFSSKIPLKRAEHAGAIWLPAVLVDAFLRATDHFVFISAKVIWVCLL